MSRRITAYELVQRYRQEYGTLPTFGLECTELQFYADREGYEMLPDDDVLSVVHQMRSLAQPAQGQPGLFDN